VSDSPIDWKTYTPDFKDFTLKQFEDLPEDAPNRPLKVIQSHIEGKEKENNLIWYIVHFYGSRYMPVFR
jgi:hypothetical protein